MNYYIGIDGGGTKTAFIAFSEQEPLKCYQHLAGSANYKQVGMDGVLAMLEDGLEKIAEKIAADEPHFYTCLGLPMYRESKVFDQLIEEKLAQDFDRWNIHLVNDCEVGWAGSLGLESGINIVSGTGSISFGRNEEGKTASVGGWSDYFSDEGSCKWLGVKCMELFSKESDGRLPKGPLLQIVRETFALEQDKDIIDLFEEQYMPYRDKIASLQRYLLEAARQGDQAAVHAYEQAAEELTLILVSTARQLNLKEQIKVTCSGGLFKVGEVIWEPFTKILEQNHMILTKSLFSPEKGAALLAAEHWTGKAAAKKIKREWEKTICF